MSLKHEARSGTIWLVGSQFTNMGVAFGLTIILSRLLAISEFGLMTLTTIFFSVGSIFSTVIFRETVILRQDLGAKSISGVFWIGVLFSLTSGVAIALIAAPVAEFINAPDLRPILWIAAASVVANGLGAVPSAIRIVKRDFARVGLQTGILSVVLSPLTVILAYYGFGAASPALTGFAFYSLSTALNWMYAGWLPLSPTKTRAYGAASNTMCVIAGQESLSAINGQFDRGLVGSLLGSHELGVFSMGRRLNDLMLDAVVFPSIGVAIPLIASLQGHVDRLRSAYLQTLSLAMVLTVPVNLGLFVTGDLVIRVLFGDKWLEAAPVLHAFAFMGLIGASSSVQRAVIQGAGRPEVWLRIQVANTIANILVIVVAAPHGLTTLAYSMLARAWLLSPLGFIAAAQVTRAGVREHTRILLAPILSGLGMSFGVVLVRSVLPTSLTPLLVLVILIPMGAIIYMLLISLSARSQLASALSFIFKR